MKKYSADINIFDDDFTRPVKASDLLPVNNNHDKRFEQNALLYGKTRFEEKTTIIKSLEEEIVSMKHKLSFIYEKDTEISKLKDKVLSLQKQIKDLEGETKEVNKLRLSNTKLRNELEQLRLQTNNIDKLETENKLLINKLKDIDSNETIEEIDDIEDIDYIDDNDDIQKDEEMIVNIPLLRKVLFNRLQDKQKKHIETLIHSYGLKKMNKVKKSVMENLLEEAIHL